MLGGMCRVRRRIYMTTDVWQLPLIGRFLDGVRPDHPGVERIPKDVDVSQADASV